MSGSIVLMRNPLQPSSREVYDHNGPIIHWLQEHVPNGFDGNLSVYLNGKELPLDLLDTELQDDDVCALLVTPAAEAIGAYLLQALIAAAVSFAVAKLFGPKSSMPGFADTPEANTVYSLSAQQNAARVGGVIPVVYGTVKQNPDYASQPYTSFDEIVIPSGASSLNVTNIDRNIGDGDQYLFYVLALGQGLHRIDDILLGDTSTSILTSDTVDVFDAPQNVHVNQMGTLSASLNAKITAGPQLHENVVTSLEVGGQEYTEPFKSAFFPVGSAAVDRISIDLVFNRGLYHTDDQGKFKDVILDLIVHVKDSTGAIIQKAINFHSTVENVTPFRRTISFDVPLEKYTVALERVTAAADKRGRTSDAVTWTSLRGYIPNSTAPVYGNTHLLAVRIKATNLISQAATSRIQVRLARVLETYTGQMEVTNNPVDVVNDIMRNTTYGARRPANEVDDAAFRQMRQHWGGGSAPYGFNAVFNGESTVFEALKVALEVVAAQPLAMGSFISIAADNKKAIRTQIYSEANMLMKTFALSYNFDRVGANNGVQVGYRDPLTWLSDFAVYPPGASDPAAIELFGCTSKQHAEKYARLMWQRLLYQRKTVSFETELEGLIPRPGDRIAITHTLAKWGQSGIIVAIDPGTMRMDTTVLLNWGTSSSFVIFRDKDGTPLAPIAVTPGPTKSSMIMASLPAIDFSDLPYTQPLFMFGQGSNVTRDFVVSSITHNGGVTTKVEAEVYDERTYAGSMEFLGAAI